MQKLTIIACIVLCSCAGAFAQERLLSRNATYQVIGQGYTYPGQVMPGTNEKPIRAEWLTSPLVEQTDGGATLIDGKTGDSSLVYTPWRWHGQQKRIIVQMTLPGQSKVNRVDVHLPQAPSYSAYRAVLHVKAPGGKWQKIATIQPDAKGTTKLVFQLDSIECRELKVVVDGNQGQLGVTEIAVWGDGPTAGKTRGLIRTRPHLETMTHPEPKVAPDSVLLSKPGMTKVKLSGTPLTSGIGSMLVDGDRTEPIRIDSKPYKSVLLTVDINLGRAYQVDTVNVWMPGGKGRQTGHVQSLALAISPSRGGSDWQTPVDLVTNPYWPGDDAPKPYVIPIGDLNVVGRRVRIAASLSGLGNVTNRLALAEVEVWGRKAEQKPAPSARLRMRPIRIKPEPVGELHTKLKWMTNKKVRAAWFGDNLFEMFPGTDKTKGQVLADAGFNLVRVSGWVDRKNRDVSPFIDNHLAGNVKEARRLGIALLIGWQYGSVHQEPYRRYRAPSGLLNTRTCCPLDSDYLERHIARWAIAIARGGADGMVIDTEMYESDQTAYVGPCVCDDCFAVYLKTFAKEWQYIYDHVPAQRRGLWLSVNEALEHYKLFAAKRIEAQYDAIRQRCQEINPAFVFGHAPALGHIPGMERGLGTPSVPCLVFSEREYWRGPDGKSYANVQEIRQENIPALYLPGLFIAVQSPAQIADNALISSLYTDGWWLYYASAVLNYPGADDPKAFHPGYGRVKGTSAGDYLDRIAAMHHRLDALLSGPRKQWPKRK